MHEKQLPSTWNLVEVLVSVNSIFVILAPLIKSHFQRFPFETSQSAGVLPQ